MKLHSVSWVIAPLVILFLAWLGAASSTRTAEALVETGLLAPSGSAFVLLPAGHGTGLGLSSILIYVGAGFVLGSLVSLSKALDYVWDEKDVEYVLDSGVEKNPSVVED